MNPPSPLLCGYFMLSISISTKMLSMASPALTLGKLTSGVFAAQHFILSLILILSTCPIQS